MESAWHSLKTCDIETGRLLHTILIKDYTSSEINLEKSIDNETNYRTI